jgi:hypothetical protein
MLLNLSPSTLDTLGRLDMLFGGPDESYAPVQFTHEASSAGLNTISTGSIIDLGNVFAMAHTAPAVHASAAFSFLASKPVSMTGLEM